MFRTVMYRVRHLLTNTALYNLLAGLPGFARNSCSIIGHNVGHISGRFPTLLNFLPHTPPPPMPRGVLSG